MMNLNRIGLVCLLTVGNLHPCLAKSRIPKVLEVQLWAVQAARLDLARHDSAWSRIRKAGWAPETKIGWLSGEDYISRSQLKVSFDDIDGDGSTTEGTNIDSRVELSLRWQFEDLIFHPREVSLLRELRQSSSARLVLLDRVTRLYFDWIDATQKLTDQTLGDLEYRRTRMLTARLVGHLDALTAGRFSHSQQRGGTHAK